MNLVFFWIVVISFAVSGVREILWTAPAPVAGRPDVLSPMAELGKSMVDQAGTSVTLAIGLIGVMTLFLGLMKVAEAGGLLVIIARTIRPLMTRLFPEVPGDHPAMGAMILNFSANVLGLGNAATPFGIRAMQELEKLNRHPGTASNAMVMFLAINTSSITLLPTGVISLRVAAGSIDPAAIVPTTLFATICSTAVAILAVRLYQGFYPLPATAEAPLHPPITRDEPVFTDSDPAQDRAELPAVAIADVEKAFPVWISWAVLGGIVALIPITILWGRAISPWIIPGLMVALLAFGWARKVPVYEVFVEGAKEGFNVAVRIIPYLVAILVAIAMLRASGTLDAFVRAVGPYSAAIGLPAEALPMALLRNLSGSGAYGLLAALINDPEIGPDSYVGMLVSTIQGSTETTFYVLAVYFGAVQIKRMRHALAAGLTADAAGIAASVIICLLLFRL